MYLYHLPKELQDMQQYIKIVASMSTLNNGINMVLNTYIHTLHVTSVSRTYTHSIQARIRELSLDIQSATLSVENTGDLRCTLLLHPQTGPHHLCFPAASWNHVIMLICFPSNCFLQLPALPCQQSQSPADIIKLHQSACATDGGIDHSLQRLALILITLNK